MIKYSWYFLIHLICFNTLSSQIPNPNHIPYLWKTDTTKKAYGFDELSIAAKKDEIKSLDFPKFISKKDASYEFFEHEPAIVVNIGGEARAYPLSILTLYEMCNDSIGGKQIMVTYCPLCNAALVFNRHLTSKKDSIGKLFHYGISGLLIHNDMVMYDKETESWWGQLTGECIAGAHAGAVLKMFPSLLISLKDFFDRYPNGKILSPMAIKQYIQKKGHRPFHHLEHNDSLSSNFYLPEKVDHRLPPLEHVLAIHFLDFRKIYPFHELAKKLVLHDIVEKSKIVIFYHEQTVSVLDEDILSKAKKIGSATAFLTYIDGVDYTFKRYGNYFIDEQTNSKWGITGYCMEGVLKGKQLNILPHTNHFAFAYLAFFPKVAIYKN